MQSNSSILLAEKNLFEFMAIYYSRDKLENEQAKILLYKIHNDLFPDEKEERTSCDSCTIIILKKLKSHYELLNSKKN